MKKKKILLVSSIEMMEGNELPQFGQLILRKILSSKYDVEMVNFDWMNTNEELCFSNDIGENIEAFSNYLLSRAPEVIGFYTLSDSFAMTCIVSKRVKERNREIKIIYGGPHVTIIARECLKGLPFVDAVAIGEGENSILPLVDALTSGSSLKNVPGIAFREHGEIVCNKNAPLIPSHELTEYVEFDLSPFEYQATPAKYRKYRIEAGRGCPFACSFCSTSKFWGRKYRIKRADQIITEIKEYIRLHQIHEFNLQHDMLTADKNFMRELCRGMRQIDDDFVWNCSARADCIDEEMLDDMAASKCTAIYIGVETGSPRMQEIVNKKLDLERSVKMIEYAAKIGIEPTVSFIFGFPDETIEDAKMTLKLIEMLLLNGIRKVQLHQYMLLPGTEDTDKKKSCIYLDEEKTPFSIHYRKIIRDPEIRDMVESNPEVFIQYYTFRSEVTERFYRMDMFVAILRVTIHKCPATVKALLLRYGLEGLYERYCYVLEQLFDSNNEKGISICAASGYLMNSMDQCFEKMIEAEKESTDIQHLEDIYIFEKQLQLCREVGAGIHNNVKYPLYLKFDIDVVAAVQRSQIIYQKTVICYNLNAEGEPIVKKLIVNPRSS